MTSDKNFWSDRYGDVPPLGFMLRAAFSDRWFRLHALPRSKRYAENNAERKIILDRANRIGEELFAEAGPIWLMFCRPNYDARDISFDSNSKLEEELNLHKLYDWVDMTEPPEDRVQWTILAKGTIWRTNTFDDLLLKVANDETSGITFVSQKTGEVFAPYDGGFDLILNDPPRVSAIATKFPDWSSERADGL
ncbi:MAG: hypothetical protein DHS20C05_12520 [Hyphococcus sp.]|nr:MAG: hypothetical protein DHS20C05_12520 [Marinicaulis sp.]